MIERKSPQGVVWLESELLSAPGGAVHGFSTRLGGVSRGCYASLNLGHTRGDDPAAVRENYRRFLSAVGAGGTETLVLSHQVHGHTVRACTAADRGYGLDRERDYEADALMTEEPDVTLGIFTADCIPILFYDPVRQAAAAAHAGWRGTAQAIAAHTVREMGRVYGCKAGHIRAAIGPGIGPCCFLCHEDVPQAMTAALGELARPYIRPAEDGRYHVDLKGINEAVLHQAGVTQVEVCGACTGCLKEKYYHHRFTGANRGSMVSVIALQARR